MASGTKHFFPFLSARPSVQEVDKNNSPPHKNEGRSRNGPQVAFFFKEKIKWESSSRMWQPLDDGGKLIFFPISLYIVSLPYISSLPKKTLSILLIIYLGPFPISRVKKWKGKKKKKSYRWATRLNDTNNSDAQRPPAANSPPEFLYCGARVSARARCCCRVTLVIFSPKFYVFVSSFSLVSSIYTERIIHGNVRNQL